MNAAADTFPAAPTEPPTEPLSASDRVQHALARIDASRAAMRRVMVPQPDSPAPSGYGDDGAHSAWSQRFAAGWQHWRQALAEHPAVAVAMDALQSWWKRQPLRPAVETAAGELRGAIVPLVRRHPALAVAIAAALGAAIVLGRPWRWRAVNRHLADAPQRAARWLWHQLTQAPVQSLLASLFVAWAAARQAPAADAPVAPDTGPPHAAPPAAAPPATAERAPAPAADAAHVEASTAPVGL